MARRSQNPFRIFGFTRRSRSRKGSAGGCSVFVLLFIGFVVSKCAPEKTQSNPSVASSTSALSPRHEPTVQRVAPTGLDPLRPPTFPVSEQPEVGPDVNKVYSLLDLEKRGFVRSMAVAEGGINYWLARSTQVDREYSVTFRSSSQQRLQQIDAEIVISAPGKIDELARNFYQHVVGISPDMPEVQEARAWLQTGTVGRKQFGRLRCKTEAPTQFYRRLSIALVSPSFITE